MEKNNSTYERALHKIERDSKCKPTCCMMIGPTGATERLFKSSNHLLS